MKRRETGMLGERLASEFLEKNGYQILDTNYRCPDGEIDIIAWHEDTLVFIEVRTKNDSRFGVPEESITPVKKERLKKVAAHYCQNHDNLLSSYRIDVVAIQMNNHGRISRIEIIENAIEET